jgi:hypothetical protein
MIGLYVLFPSGVTKKYVDTFWGTNNYNENRWRCSLYRRRRSATWRRAWVPCLMCRTVRALGSDGPRVRRGGEVHRRCLHLAPERDPVGEERS